MTDKAAPDKAAEAQLAKSKAQREAILAENKEREKWMPTPTQEENDAAAMGQPVEKKPDGSPVEQPPEHAAGHKPEHKPEHTTRHMEAKKPEGSGYSTRDAG